MKLLMIGQRKCPKHVEFFDKIKFGKFVCLVGFIKNNLFRYTMKEEYKRNLRRKNKERSTKTRGRPNFVSCDAK
jgi:hypothetical protein